MQGGSEPNTDLGRFAPDLRETCSEYLHRYRSELERGLDAGDSGVELSKQYARSLDGLVSALACTALAVENVSPNGGIAVAAVGGYGRGLVALHSDVDVLFLCHDSKSPEVHRIAEQVLYPLWDIGLPIGHAVRTSREALELAPLDLATATTLLDIRVIAGDRQLAQDLVASASSQFFEPRLEDFLESLQVDMARRHKKSGDSPYLLEPDVKLGRGGLRDLDVAMWIAAARWRVRTLNEHVGAGALRQSEADELRDASEFLWRVRNMLHRRARRKHDRLTFPDQEDIAEALGFVDGITLAVEQFMQAYYRHARVVARTAERLLSRAQPARVAVGKGRSLHDSAIVEHAGAIDVDSESLRADPTLALKAYEWSWKERVALTGDARDTIEGLASGAEFGERLRASPAAPALFLKLLCCTDRVPSRRDSLVAELHETGLLLAMIPEFGPVTARVQYDAYHLYTVDVHAVRAVEFLASLVRGDEADRLALPCELATGVKDPTALVLATLMHDLGKSYGTPVGERAWRRQRQRGAAMARKVAARMNCTEDQIELTGWLVEHHLSLYEWATRRDTSDPDTVAEFAQTVRSAERLIALYLITVSVLATTNAREMTAWKARLLEDMYLACEAVLTGSSPQGSRHGLAESVREEVREGFLGDSARQQLEEFLDDMPDRYLLANPVDGIRRHARFQRERDDDTVQLGVFDGPTEDVAELVVVATDRAGLLADITAVLAAKGLAVVQAQIYTRTVDNKPSQAIDVFHVTRPGWEENPVDATLAAEIETTLRDLELGNRTPSQVFGGACGEPVWARRRVPDVETEVVVDDSLTPHFTVVDVFTRDRIGLLYFIAATFRELGHSVALSKISTEGMRTADTFYLQKVQDREAVQRLPSQLKAALRRFHESCEQPTASDS